MPVHVSVGLPTAGSPGQDADPANVTAAAAAAERLGFDAVWLGDHVLHPQPMLDSLVCLSLAAASTTSIGLEISVLQLALRPLPIIAKQVATLACYAPGRVTVGVGIGGEYAAEWAICGVPRADRGRRTDIAAAQLRRVLRGQPIEIDGMGEQRLDPTPTEEVPLFFGGRKPGAMRRAAELGDGWVGWLHSPTGFRGMRESLSELRQGNDAPFWFGIQVPVHLTTVGEDSESMSFPAPTERYRLVGSPADLVAGLRPYVDAGADRIKLSLLTTGPEALTQIEALGCDVLPALHSWDRS